MFNIDILQLEEEMLEKNFAKDRVIIVDIYFSKYSYVPTGYLHQDGVKSIQLDISWYELEKVNLSTIQMIIDSAKDVHDSILDFLDKKSYKYHSTNKGWILIDPTFYKNLNNILLEKLFYNNNSRSTFAAFTSVATSNSACSSKTHRDII